MKKSKKIQVRLTEDEFEKIRQFMADYEYRNLSEFIRDGALKPSRKNKKLMGSMIYEVNKIGVNLNQAIHRLHLQEIDHTELLKVINQTNHILSNILCVYGKL
jgi:Arc/MetJ-type ribon-helix-helix transcriptional regulator